MSRKDVYMIVETNKEKEGQEGKKDAFWTKIGVAFENKDGSLNVVLNAFPVDGKLNIRDPKPAAADKAAVGA